LTATVGMLWIKSRTVEKERNAKNKKTKQKKKRRKRKENRYE